ncbi:hypothetical protein A2872_02010 [Candidatus Gottesmanbacteria bacterium RIFCSPHIGHO2_01_FULL_42_12]|uniref:Nudix hydrolase domain-containing protein n=1 Tax=Candidatus Gottesmanbacteria bacterium RIFCSPHIGHO2_01_FULL_42_12 TaxID=1798377 RepID=A0A1F5Z5P4_9BACT|nr:MAG: hypothetical protein A2872_02010 [Candidatus Gottesmanbacteria bacterium RIFCSPHIGHO2_01_FULL_42_12]
MKICAGILLYRSDEVFLTHPGGPFFAKKDNCWGIPKGESLAGENLLDTARREFFEETGIKIPDDKKLLAVGQVKYNNKVVHCWATEYTLKDSPVIKSNLSKFGWPEIDKAQFFDFKTALAKILPAQQEFIKRLIANL